MGKTLVLAEKPSVGRDLAKVLKCTKSTRSYIEGDKYVITWGLGHLIELAAPENYDNRYKEWKMEDLPMLPEKMKTGVIKKTGKQFYEIKKLMQRKDIDELVIATDPGREGELVARWIIKKAGWKKPMKRLWISSQTDKAIKDGFKNLQPATKYDHLYLAAVCRAEADWVVGLNITRALTCKYNAQLSAGRVQSATLAMIVDREEAIKNFEPVPYFTIQACTKNYHFQWQDKKKNQKIWEEKIAKQLINKMEGKPCKIVEKKESYKKQYAPLFYDLTELQRDANRLFGYSAKQTLNIMQRLYENYKVLTYPRTDSKYISTDIVPTLKERIKAIVIGEHKEVIATLLKSPIKENKRFVDNNKVTDHHGIIPTEQKVNIAKFSQEERRIYDLVIKRFLAVLSPPFEYIQMTLTGEIAGENMFVTGKRVQKQGWKILYNKEEMTEETKDREEQVLPDMEEGDTIAIQKIVLGSNKTTPPARFNEGTLLAAMEKPHQYMNIASKYAKTLGETGGIGTVATRADIIEKLFQMYYIEKQGKEILPTSKGKQLISLVPEELKSPIMTAKWENALEAISKGKQNPKIFSKQMREYAVTLVKQVKQSKEKYIHDNTVGKKCPNCAKPLLEVKGKRGILYVCQDRKCGYKETISRFTNTRCPNCHKKLEIRGQGEGQIYVCTTCTFREKLSSFEKKYRKQKEKVGKRDVQKYLTQQQKDTEINNSAFAEIFGK